MRKLLFPILALAAVTLSASASAESLYLYLNQQNGETPDVEAARNIFQGNRLVWEKGGSIVILLDELSSVEDRTFESFAGISESRFLEVWRIKFFSGRAMIPIQVKSTEKAFELLLESKESAYFSFKETPAPKGVRMVRLEF